MRIFSFTYVCTPRMYPLAAEARLLDPLEPDSDELHAGVENLTLVLCKIKCSKLLCPLSNPNVFLRGPPTLTNCRTKVHVSYSTQSSRDVRSRLKF